MFITFDIISNQHFLHSTLCSIRPLLYLTLFPINFFYHSTSCPIRRLLYSTVFPVIVFYFLTFCAIRHLLPLLLCSSPLFPIQHFVLSNFCYPPFDFFPINFLFQSTFCLWMFLSSAFFCTPTFCRRITIHISSEKLLHHHM